MSEELGMTTKKENFSEWYNEVIQKAEIADHSAVSGCMVIRPYSFAIWENVKENMDKMLKEIGVKNAYFPLLIPERLLMKESQHIEGFTPEVAWVTQNGDNEMEERLAVRPTSETIMYDSYSKWVRSWRDLPMRINQWVNVMRWEFKHPQLFLRTREFLWQEGHTVHASEESAREEIDQVREIYRKICEDYMALPTTLGEKTEKERFAGALGTYPLEHMMPNGKVIQGPDAHMLGQNFSKPFDISFENEDGKREYAWQNSWGFSTRELGVLFAVHGDDRGLIIPPKIAPIEAVIVPIYKEENKFEILEEARDLEKELSKSFKVHLDDREEHKPGFKFNEWELKGVPIRLELGPRDIENRLVMSVNRLTRDKKSLDRDNIKKELRKELDDLQTALFERAKKMEDSLTFEAKDYKELKKGLKKGRVLAPWCGSRDCEDSVKEETGAKISCIIKDSEAKCVKCGNKGKFKVYFARSY